ncbi:ParB/RepB/Spo0J family partition protein [Clostridium botulinum]|uniref:ParB/RepB/Spo0J family partition protein n=1 Tax=Clostridium botulinum TaxID=1491 RepID=UPI0013F06848|nr:ParB/RepB/Spo0J family partition protein [Clostridium botulinum]MBY6835878.1 ParB/RepB/Spo0J family partition protein [Clostridium botulinum]NFG64352.1 ParB/RepB/Spo0J family partition protein [Clostridium botulinum]NFL34155.1 ParB/RepB/Spo0J family partition protein [Clostridium botulinum]NFM03479.1 ParB/RepB/Spo0J family partition protein [Clostridium botulinum]NFQ24877.1 ParB/RepB/Spo0J family partition protein [Clostridium botulinum]
MNNEIYDFPVTQIYKTNNYDKFTNILGNRDLKERNYRKLLNSMKEKQLLIPILVNEKFEIIDGMHRFESIKILKLPLYYYIVEGYDIEDVKKANLVSCNWGIDDYLNMFVKLNKLEYNKFEDLKSQFKISTSQMLDVISTIENKSSKELKFEFQDGSFGFGNYLEVLNFFNALNDFKSFKHYRTRPFVKAFLRLYTNDGYSHKLMQDKLRRLSSKIEQKFTYSDYISLLVNDVYIYGTSKLTLRYDATNDVFYTQT